MTINSQEYLSIFSDQIHPMHSELFTRGNTLYQNNTTPIHTAKLVSEYHEEISSEIGHLIGSPQSPNLHIIKYLLRC